MAKTFLMNGFKYKNANNEFVNVPFLRGERGIRGEAGSSHCITEVVRVEAGTLTTVFTNYGNDVKYYTHMFFHADSANGVTITIWQTGLDTPTKTITLNANQYCEVMIFSGANELYFFFKRTTINGDISYAHQRLRKYPSTDACTIKMQSASAFTVGYETYEEPAE